MFPWSLMVAELYGVSSHTGSILMTKNGASIQSDDASTCSMAFSMSSCLYSGFAMQELVHRNRKAFMAVLKT
jgi:hypothetical protein